MKWVNGFFGPLVIIFLLGFVIGRITLPYEPAACETLASHRERSNYEAIEKLRAAGFDVQVEFEEAAVKRTSKRLFSGLFHRTPNRCLEDGPL
jgi:hypothetical protein